MTGYVNSRPIAGQVVADQTARLALDPTLFDGIPVYQEDIRVTYQWDNFQGRWRVLSLPGVDDLFLPGSYNAIYYYVDPTGSDLNDGRAAGAARAKQTLQGVFLELNDAGNITGPDALFVQIIMAPGAYVEGAVGLHMLSLSACIPGGVFITPSFSDYVNNEVLTQSADNGLVAGSAVERDITTNAFTSFGGRGDRFIWVNDGFTPNDDIFPAMGTCVRPSTTPNLRINSPAASTFTTFNLSQYETTLDAQRGILATDPSTVITINGMAIDNSSTNIVTYQNVSFVSCRVTSSGGAASMFLKCNHNDGTSWRGNYLSLPSDTKVNASSFSATGTNMFSCDVDAGTLSVFSGPSSFGGMTVDTNIALGGFSPSLASGVSSSVSAMDFLNTGAGLAINGHANVRQLGDWVAPNATSAVVIISDNSRLTRQTGDLTAANGGLAGPVITLSNMSQAIDVSAYTGITTTPAGNDIQVGANAVAALGTLPATDFALGDTSEGCRAT